MMVSDPSDLRKKWYSNGRWAWAFGIAGIAIVAFVAATEGRYYSWLLWLAIPYLMISLGYAFLVHAVPVFLRFNEDGQSEEESPEEHRQQ
jgi:hypothetical protein